MARNKRLALLVLTTILAPSPVTVSADQESGLPVELRQQLLLRQYQAALPELERLASYGNAEAQYQLALCRLDGQGAPAAPGEAVDLLLESAASGHAKANYLLGSMYYQGKAVEPNMKAAKYHLFAAAQKDHRLAGDLLRRIDGLDEVQSSGGTQSQAQLWSAARAGATDRAERALRHGARLDGADTNGDTALVIAISNRQESMAVWLLGRGADPDLADRTGNGPLHLAARRGMAEATRHLIEAGATIDAPNRDGRTPLILAVSQRNQDLVEQLLAAGASPGFTDKQGRSARDLAASLDDPAIARLMGPRQPASIGTQPQRLAMLRKQIQEPGSLYRGWPIVAAAVAQDELDLALSLVNDGADPWLATPKGDSAVFLAMERDHDALARALLKVSPVRDERQQAEAVKLLALAATRGESQLVSDLVAVVPATSSTLLPIDQTPLWLAIQSGNSRVALQLMGWQPPDLRTDSAGMDLMLLSSRHGLIPVMLGLRSRGFGLESSDAGGRTAAWLAADQGHCELLGMLLARGAAVDAADRDGQTPLIRAVLARAPDCVALALESGAEVDHRTRSGNTALMLAAESDAQIVGQLLAAGADYELRNESSHTALMLAASSGCIDCAETLIAAGANARRRNAQGANAIDLAGDNPALLAALGR